jgi:formylglycine-generating enzyme required for sulfatase activity
MKFACPLFVAVLWTSTVCGITVVTVPVGDAGNPSDFGRGEVDYTYRIGKYEVTVGQYTAFLNAVATTDTYGLYNTNMATDTRVAGIARGGAAGSYTYMVIGSPNHPVTYVNWGDAARFTNWLHNGQPTGTQNVSTTEGGAYTLNGATSNAALSAASRNTGAKWYLPNHDEWYKAAYYDPVVVHPFIYWRYPMRTDDMPHSDQPPGATPDNTRVANFRYDDNLSTTYNDGYAATGNWFPENDKNYLTDVGAYTRSTNYYGTFDQGGNVAEWDETNIGPWRRISGGDWLSLSTSYPAQFMEKYSWGDIDPTTETSALGFRVASASLPDYNHSGIVDSADYVVWRKNGGPTIDYTLWRAYFGENLSGSGASFGSAIPEPASMSLIIVGVLACVTSRSTRTAKRRYVRSGLAPGLRREAGESLPRRASVRSPRRLPG